MRAPRRGAYEAGSEPQAKRIRVTRSAAGKTNLKACLFNGKSSFKKTEIKRRQESLADPDYD